MERSSIFLILAWFFLGGLLSQTLTAQSPTEEIEPDVCSYTYGSDILGTGGSLGMSGDGNVMVVGDIGVPAAYLYETNATTGSFRLVCNLYLTLSGPDAASLSNFGNQAAVHYSALRSTYVVAVGAPGITGAGAVSGAIAIFTYRSGACAFDAILSDTVSGGVGDSFSYRLAMSGDGNAVVAGTDPTLTSSQIVVFRYNATIPAVGWARAAAWSGLRYAYSLAINYNGTRVAVGDYSQATVGNGLVWLYSTPNVYNRSSPFSCPERSLADSSTASTTYGCSVAMNGAGTAVLVGSTSDSLPQDTASGLVWSYQASGAVGCPTWSTAAASGGFNAVPDTLNGRTGSLTGYAIAMADNGRVAVSAPNSMPPGYLTQKGALFALVMDANSSSVIATGAWYQNPHTYDFSSTPGGNYELYDWRTIQMTQDGSKIVSVAQRLVGTSLCGRIFVLRDIVWGPSSSPTPSLTPSATASASVSASASTAASPSFSASVFPSFSLSPSITASETPSTTITKSASGIATRTASRSATRTATRSQSISFSTSPSASPTATSSPSQSSSPSSSCTPSPSPSRYPSRSRTPSRTQTKASGSVTPTLGGALISASFDATASSPPLTTTPTPLPADPAALGTASAASGGGGGLGIAIGGGVGSLLVLMGASIGLFFFLRQRRQKQQQQAAAPFQSSPHSASSGAASRSNADGGGEGLDDEEGGGSMMTSPIVMMNLRGIGASASPATSDDGKGKARSDIMRFSAGPTGIRKGAGPKKGTKVAKKSTTLVVVDDEDGGDGSFEFNGNPLAGGGKAPAVRASAKIVREEIDYDTTPPPKHSGRDAGGVESHSRGGVMEEHSNPLHKKKGEKDDSQQHHSPAHKDATPTTKTPPSTKTTKLAKTAAADYSTRDL